MGARPEGGPAARRGYDEALRSSFVWRDLRRVRNMRPGVRARVLARRGAGRAWRRCRSGRSRRGDRPTERDAEQELFTTGRARRVPGARRQADVRQALVGLPLRQPDARRPAEPHPGADAGAARAGASCGCGCARRRSTRSSRGEGELVEVKVTPSNCVQCGAITAKGGRLTPPEGGSGPSTRSPELPFRLVRRRAEDDPLGSRRQPAARLRPDRKRGSANHPTLLDDTAVDGRRRGLVVVAAAAQRRARGRTRRGSTSRPPSSTRPESPIPGTGYSPEGIAVSGDTFYAGSTADRRGHQGQPEDRRLPAASFPRPRTSPATCTAACSGSWSTTTTASGSPARTGWRAEGTTSRRAPPASHRPPQLRVLFVWDATTGAQLAQYTLSTATARRSTT